MLQYDVDFVVDRTLPSMALANLANNEHYTEDAHNFQLTVRDNAGLDHVEVYINGELWKTFTAEEVAAANGTLDIELPSSDSYQEVSVIAYDAAGNVTDPVAYRVLVTSNKWVQFVNNKPAFGGSIAGVCGAAALIIILAAVKRRKKEKKAARCGMSS